MSKIKKNLWRHVLQLGVIAVIAGFILKVFFGGAPADVEAYCPFGGLQSLVTDRTDHDGGNPGNRRYSFQ